MKYDGGLEKKNIVVKVFGLDKAFDSHKFSPLSTALVASEQSSE